MLNKRFPTILGLLIIIVGIASVVYLIPKPTRVPSKASPTSDVFDLTITNVSDTGFTLSWITDGEFPQYVVVPESPKKTFCQPEYSTFSGPCYYDDHDLESHIPSKRATHYVSIDSLSPATNYSIKIYTSGTKTPKTYKEIGGSPIATGPKIENGSPMAGVIYGVFYDSSGKTPADGALVYMNTEKGAKLSTLVKSSGAWLITLNKLRTASLDSFLKLGGGESFDLEVKLGTSIKSVIKTTVSASQPLPNVSIGASEKYDFTTNVPVATTVLIPSPLPFKKAGFSVPTPLPSGVSVPLSITNPSQNSSIEDLPTFRGTGQPGQVINIEVNSETPLSATVKVGEDGKWVWTPPSNLSPGEHTVTITAIDEGGNKQTTTQTFTVLAGLNIPSVTSGSESAELSTPTPEATPIPTTEPTLAPMPTETPFVLPSPTSKTQEMPVTASFLPFLFALTSGVLFVTLGLWIFFRRRVVLR